MKLEKHTVQVPVYWPRLEINKRQLARWLLPTPGNVFFTVLVVAGLLWASSVGALPLGAALTSSTSTSTIAYQGRLADADGNPLTDTYNMIFRLYDAASGGVPLWEEQWTGSNGVQVSDGLFNVMLGSLTPIPQSVITGSDSLFLGITVGTDDEMTPRVQLGSVPFAVQALTVPDASIATAKIADGAVTQAKLGPDVNLSNRLIETAALTSDFVSDASAEVDVTGLSIDLNLPAASTVFVNLQYREQKADTGYYKVFILRDGAVVYESGAHYRQPGVNNHRNIAFFDTDVAAGNHTYKVQVNPRGQTLNIKGPYTQLGAIAFFND